MSKLATSTKMLLAKNSLLMGIKVIKADSPKEMPRTDLKWLASERQGEGTSNFNPSPTAGGGMGAGMGAHANSRAALTKMPRKFTTEGKRQTKHRRCSYLLGSYIARKKRNQGAGASSGCQVQKDELIKIKEVGRCKLAGFLWVL